MPIIPVRCTACQATIDRVEPYERRDEPCHHCQGRVVVDWPRMSVATEQQIRRDLDTISTVFGCDPQEVPGLQQAYGDTVSILPDGSFKFESYKQYARFVKMREQLRRQEADPDAPDPFAAAREVNAREDRELEAETSTE